MSQAIVPKEAFASKLLDKEFHERLLADLPQIVAKAGVPAHAVWSRLSMFCTPDEVSWVRALHNPSNSGLIFVGEEFDHLVEDKMVAITGVCLRNYTDARLMPVQEVVKRLKDDTMPMPTVLLIPNFCIGKNKGGDLATWQITTLMGMLIERMGKGLKTILSCDSMATVEKEYGAAFRKHIEAKYSIATPHGVGSAA